MAIRSRITDEAKRQDHIFKRKGRHPLLRRVDSPAYGLWQTIVLDGNPKGGMTAAQMQAKCYYFHPQVLADLKAAKIVVPVRKEGNTFYYIANEKGIGVLVQKVQVEVSLFEREDGSFVPSIKLLGAVDSVSPITKKLLSRSITLTIPHPFDKNIEHGIYEEETDQDGNAVVVDEGTINADKTTFLQKVG